jgi:diguanylate cyclase (GGDEF)-like protein
MIEAPLPPDEGVRVRALHDLGVLFTPAEERFERITRLAARFLRMPMALVSLVDSRIQWFKAAYGVRATETPRAISFCGYAILGDDTFVVPDALEDPRFRDNPLVTGEPFIRFYAGHPLRLLDGSKVGTLCVMDTGPRQLDEADLETLRFLAGWAQDELQMKVMSEGQAALLAERDELRRRAMLDPLTRAWNRDAILEVLERELARAARDGSPLSVIMADVDHFKGVNDSFGHPAGDSVLLGVVADLRAAVRPYDAVGRFGGEEFLVVLPHCDGAAALIIAERMRRKVEAEHFETTSGPVRATLSLGVATGMPAPGADLPGLIEAADRALYRAKTGGRNRVAVAA